jgi:hypothetical protein
MQEFGADMQFDFINVRDFHRTDFFTCIKYVPFSLYAVLLPLLLEVEAVANKVDMFGDISYFLNQLRFMD